MYATSGVFPYDFEWSYADRNVKSYITLATVLDLFFFTDAVT